MNYLAYELIMEEIADGHSLAAAKGEDGTYAVWVVYADGGTSRGPYEDVTEADMESLRRIVPASRLSFKDE